MPSISVKRLNDAAWREIFGYRYNDKGAGFKTFGCDIPNITITHDRKIGASRTIIYYTVGKRRTDSPSQAVKWWNENDKKGRIAARQPGNGSPEPA